MYVVIISFVYFFSDTRNLNKSHAINSKESSLAQDPGGTSLPLTDTGRLHSLGQGFSTFMLEVKFLPYATDYSHMPIAI